MYRKQPVIIPPWGGWDNSAPALTLPSNSFRQITNWLINKQRLIPFPKLFAVTPLTSNTPLWGMQSFQDANYLYHTLLLTSDRAYFLKSDGTYDELHSSSAAPNEWTPFLNPYSIEVFQNKAFFANGSPDFLKYSDGSTTWWVAGDVPGSCVFLGKLASRLLMINTIENGFQFGARIRWSGVNAPNEWDSTVDYTAGATDLAEVEDQLTGWATINNVGFAFRTNGISVFNSTGIGSAPWFIENYSEGPTGVGVYYPYSLSQYGQVCTFAALDDIYVFVGGTSLQPIGGKSKKSIMADLSTASSQVGSKMLGRLAPGVDFLSYWLFIPQNNDTTTSLWVYLFDSQVWTNVQLAGAVRSLGEVILT